MMEKLLTPDEVAAILRVSRRTAYRIMHQMPHLETPFRVAETGLRAWVAGRTVSPATESKGKAKARQRAAKMPLVGEVYKIPRRRA
jgi:hypothetical protein